jgi:hypothetical protein
MNGLERDEVIRMVREVADKDKVDPVHNDMVTLTVDELGRLLIAEREKVAQWMMQHGYATGHGDTIEDLLAELDWQIAENWNRALVNGMKTEREACAKVCDDLDDECEGDKIRAYFCADAIRARGNDAT